MEILKNKSAYRMIALETQKKARKLTWHRATARIRKNYRL